MASASSYLRKAIYTHAKIRDRSRIPRIELHRALKILPGFLQVPLPPIHSTENPKDFCVVRKFALSLRELLARTIDNSDNRKKSAFARARCVSPASG